MRTLLLVVLLAATACSDDRPDSMFESTLLTCAQPGNFAVNCDFDSGLAPWRINADIDPGSGTFVGSDGASELGCVELQSVDSLGATQLTLIDQCIVPSPEGVYEFGASFRITSGSVDGCDLIALPSNADCSELGANGSGVSFTPLSGWSRSAPTTIAWTSAPFIGVRLSARCSSREPFTLRFDDIFFIRRGPV